MFANVTGTSMAGGLPTVRAAQRLPHALRKPASARPASASIFRSQTPSGDQRKVPVNVSVAFPSDDAFGEKVPQGRERTPAASDSGSLAADFGKMGLSSAGVQAHRGSGAQATAAAGRASGGGAALPTSLKPPYGDAFSELGRGRSNISSITFG